MSSVLARTKQIPTDSQYFISLLTSATSIRLNFFTEDANQSTTSYVSGAAAGRFTTSNVTQNFPVDGSGSTLNLVRDMGKTILSSGRTFRAVQLLQLDGNAQTLAGGATGWTSTSGPGVWKPSTDGVSGGPSGVSGQLSDFGVFYFETGANGLGVAQGLVRYG
jgi:hypothetical protein